MATLLAKNKVDGSVINLAAIDHSHAPGFGVPIEAVFTAIQSIKDAPTLLVGSLSNLVLELVPANPLDKLRFTGFTDVGRFCSSYWIYTDSDGIEQIKDFGFAPRTVSFSPLKVEFDIPDREITRPDEFFRSRGLTPPPYGYLIFCINTSAELHEVGAYSWYVMRYASKFVVHASPAPLAARQAAPPVSKFTSAAASYETLYVPDLSAEFVYNFYQQNEDLYETIASSNFTGKPLRDIPKYIRLSWSKSPRHIPQTPPPLTIGSGPGEGRTIDKSTIVDDVKKTTAAGGAFSKTTLQSASASALRIAPSVSTASRTTTPASPSLGSIGASGDSRAPAPTRDARPRTAGTAVRLGGIVVSIDPTAVLAGSKVPSGLDASGISVEARQDLTSNPLLPDSKALRSAVSSYAGYVIVKERFVDDLEDYEITDLIGISDCGITSYIDYKIAYGETYRYSIRSVYRFVNAYDLPIFLDTDSLLNLKESAETFNEGAKLVDVFYFDSETSETVEVPAIDFVRPAPPNSVLVVPNSRDRSVLVTWTQKNPNKDVAGFNVYRRANTATSQFELLTEDLLEIRSNFFVDRGLPLETEFVYAVEAVDVHENRSQLSNQVLVSCRPQDLEIGRVENLPRMIEREGTELDVPVRISNKKSVVLSVNKKVSVVINPLFLNIEHPFPYIVRVTSIDTFEEKEIKLNFTTKIVNHRQSVVFSAEQQKKILEAIRPKDDKLQSSFFNFNISPTVRPRR